MTAQEMPCAGCGGERVLIEGKWTCPCQRTESSSMTIIETLEECREYFEQRADAEYFTDSPSAVGNEEMRLLVQVEDALRQARKGAE